MSSEAQALGKRKFPRRRFNRQVGYLADGIYNVGQCLDIGEGGASIAFKTEIGLDKNIVVNFQIPGGSFVSVRAQVRSAQSIKNGNMFVVGCSFENLQFEHKREIRAFVSARSESEH